MGVQYDDVCYCCCHASNGAIRHMVSCCGDQCLTCNDHVFNLEQHRARCPNARSALSEMIRQLVCKCPQDNSYTCISCKEYERREKPNG